MTWETSVLKILPVRNNCSSDKGASQEVLCREDRRKYKTLETQLPGVSIPSRITILNAFHYYQPS